MPGKLILYHIVFLLGIVFYPNILSAQENNNIKKSDNKVIIEGKIYFVHVVKPGHTLYSISKIYGVQGKDIALENPGVYSGLQIGQVLKIPAEASAKEEEILVVDTLKFIRHELQYGETLYRLSKIYNVPVSEIENVNSGLDYTDLSVGTIIQIPRHSLSREEEGFYYHKVRRRETIYSLSRQYNVNLYEIRKHNPEIEIAGLNPGQIIRIPKLTQNYVSGSLKDGSIYEYVIDGSELLEEREVFRLDEYSRRMKDFNRGRLKVAFLIPFDYYPEIIVKDTILDDLEDDEEKEIDPDEERMKKLPKSVNFLEFFEGSLMAIEELKSEGIIVEVQYYDTRKSPTKVREILQNSFMLDVDLIIGPFYSWNVEIVSDFSKEKGIPLISPFYENSDLTEENPFLFQMNPSYKIEYRTAAKILAKDYDKNFLFIYGKDSLKMGEFDYFKTSLLGALRNFTHEENIVLKEIVYKDAAKSDLSDDLAMALSKDKKNVVVIPETNEAFVSNLITQLYFQLRDFDIEVFGMPHFSGFDNVEQQYFHSLNLRYVTPYNFTYSDSAISEFLSDFRLKFKSEPVHFTRKGCSYAFLGYDLSYFFIKTISKDNRNFIKLLNRHDSDDFLIPIHFVRPSKYGGFENYDLKLIEFKSDFRIDILDVSNIHKERIKSRTPWNFGFDY
ncbi:MAG: LysM peptidoglycan-binding domain-containing protein [Bacteroidales bacterium]|nr:LysM peptidoglycan-binding domain-containing protein [Bacteroidales bacterium]